ncbi:MAG: AAA family ATPase [Hyphomicrobiaceae bacterium]|nr:AAA family ATPase [Hyphomicrobiaceae bacterium]
MSQDVVFAHMARPVSYAPVPDKVERIDTHAAVIFLAGNFAYKLKRAVKLPYLDFSTLKQRRAICTREVEINRRTAPDVYLGVVPIVRAAEGTLEIDGLGEPVEWAIRMRRFDEAELFDRLASAGNLPLGLMAPLADEIAALHGGERSRRNIDGAAMMKGVVEPVLKSLGRDVSVLKSQDVADLARALRRELRAQAGLLRTRARQGYVRHCHGDLHLQNIVRIDGNPVLFDAIEFDDRMATVDTLYDLAFLLMDLWHRGLSTHANTLLNAYLQRSCKRRPMGSLRGLALLPLFLSVRASVRSMVALDRLAFANRAGSAAARRDAGEYLQLARDVLQPASPRLVAIGGLSGTGKSTLAAALAPDVGAVPGAIVLRSDIERKRLAGVNKTTRLKSEHYTPAATGRVYRALFAKAESALDAGRTVILDAVFARPHQRRRVAEIAREANVPFTGIWLEASDQALIERVEARRGDASDANARVVRNQLGYEIGEIDWHRVNASGARDKVRNRVFKLLRSEA